MGFFRRRRLETWSAFKGPLAEIAEAANPGGGSLPTMVDHPDPAHAQDAFVFFVTTLALLARLAKVDGLVSLEEIQAFDNFIRTDLECDGMTRQFAVRIFNHARDSEVSHSALAKAFRRQFSDRPQMQEELLDLLCALAMSDGVLHPKEEKLLDGIAKSLGFPRKILSFLKLAHQDTEHRWHAVLQCPPGAPLEVAEAQHALLSKRHDPDTLVALGLPPAFAAMARRRLRGLDEALDRLKEPLGVG